MSSRMRARLKAETNRALLIGTIVLCAFGTILTSGNSQNGMVSGQGWGLDNSSSGPSLMPAQDPSMQYLEPEYPLKPFSDDGPSSRTARALGSDTVLVLNIDFQDYPHFSSHDQQNIYNRTFSKEPGYKSMNNYFDEVSRGKFDLVGDVVPWVTSVFNMSEYGEDPANGWPDSANGPIYRLVTEAVLMADSLVDFSQFDTDNDGFVDHLIVIHAGQGQEAAGGTSNDIWSHHWAVLDANLTEPGSQPLMADGVRIYNYNMFSEHSPLGTMVHEYGHELGLPDLYDIDGSSFGIGKWGLMGSGSWNGGGNSPAHLCAWSKARLGWIEPVDVLKPMLNMTVGQVETQGYIYRLWIGDPASSDEYFLLENRQRVGFDEKLPGDGLLIWHLDDGQTSNSNEVHRLVDLEEADEEVNGDSPYQKPDAWTDNAPGFYQFSIPNSNGYDGHPSAWTVKDIGASGPNMTISIDILANDVGVSFLDFDRYTGEGIPVDIVADVFNFGINRETDILVNVRISQSSVIVDSVNKTVADLDTKSTKNIKVTFTPEVKGNYLISVRTILESDQIPENNEAIGVLHVTKIRFFDDVEGGENGWVHSSNRPPSDIWRIVSDPSDATKSKSPVSSWFCGVDQLGGGTYVPFSEYYLERTIDMRSINEGFLIFSHRFDLSLSVQNKSTFRSDTGHVEIKTNLDTFYTTLDSFEGTSGGWNTQIYKISEYIDNPAVVNITIRFRLQTQLLRMDKGWWLDDILVVGEWYEYDAAILFDEDLMSSKPAETKTTGITLWNIGSTVDSYQLSTSAPPFWNSTLPTYDIIIEPFRSKALTLTFTAALDAEAGFEANIRVGLTSKGDTTVSRTGTLLVIIEKTYGLEIDPGPGILAEPGTQETVTVSVINEGNGDQKVQLNLSGKGAPWSSISASELDLAPFETRNVEVIMDIPIRSEEGDRSEVKVRAYSTDGLDDTGTISITFARVYDIGLEPILDDLSVPPGGSVDLEFRLFNLGNGKDTVDIVYETPPEWNVDGDTRMVLGPWENATILITVEVSETTPLSDFKIGVLASSVDGGAKERIDLGVKVVLPDPAIDRLSLSKTYVNGKKNISVTVVIENLGNGNASSIIVGFFDNGKEFYTGMIEVLGSKDQETLNVSHRFGKGQHDVAVVLTYEGAQGDDTNDEAHENMKVIDPPAFIPGMGMPSLISALSLAIYISVIGHRRYRQA